MENPRAEFGKDGLQQSSRRKGRVSRLISQFESPNLMSPNRRQKAVVALPLRSGSTHSIQESPIPASSSLVRSSTTSHPSVEQEVGETTNAAIWRRALGIVSNEQRWQVFEAQFREKEAVLSIDTIIRGLNALKNSKDDEMWSIGSQGRVKPRVILDKIVGYASNFKDAGAALAGCDPTQHAGMAWSILQCLVSFAVNNKQAHDLANDHEFIAEIMCHSCVYANIYLEQPYIQVQQDLLEALENLYVQLLRFLMEAWTFVTQSKFRHALMSLNASSAVGDTKRTLQDAYRKLGNIQQTANAEVTVRSSKDISILKRLLKHTQDLQVHTVQWLDDFQTTQQMKQREEVLQWLSSVRQWIRYDEVKYRTPGTGIWLLRDPGFVQWESRNHASILWLRGKMGSGKSTLTALVVERLHQQVKRDGTESVAFFFCDRTSRPEELHDEAVIFRVLLKQLFRFSNLPLPERLLKQYSRRKSDGLLDGITCTKLILALTDEFEHTSIIIDALDECSFPVRKALLLRLLLPLAERMKNKVRILISSRPGPDFEKYLEFNVLEFPEHVRVVQVSNNDDIALFIHEKLGEVLDPDYFAGNFLATKNKAEKHLLKKADGMFRWVQLALSQVQGRPEEVLESLMTLPDGLLASYSILFQSIPRQDLDMVRKALLLICHGFRPLLLDEIVEAVFNTGLQEPQLHYRLRLLRGCSQFVVHDTEVGEVRLAHLSVKEFLESYEDFPKYCDAHSQLADFCLKPLITFFDSKAPDAFKVWDLGHFISYAISFLPFHVLATLEGRFREEIKRVELPVGEQYQLGETRIYYDLMENYFYVAGENWEKVLASNSADNDTIWKKLCISPQEISKQDDPLLHWMSLILQYRFAAKGVPRIFNNALGRTGSQYSHGPNQLHVDVTPLDTVFLFQITDIISDARAPGGKWDFRSAAYKRTLQEFCSWASISELKSDRAALPRIAFQSILDLPYAVHSAVRKGDHALLAKLLELGANFEPAEDGIESALHIASAAGHLKCVDTLLAHGANPRREDERGWTALHCYAHNYQNGDAKVPKSLLDAGGDVNHREKQWLRTPMLNAAVAIFNPKSEMLRFLFESGAETSSVDRLGNNGLHLATRSPVPNISNIEVLIEYGIEIDQTNSVGQTSLHQVISSGARFAFDCLLQRGADVFLETAVGTNYLHHAAMHVRNTKPAYLHFLKELVRFGLKMDTRSADGAAVLHFATTGPSETGQIGLLQTKDALERMQWLIEAGADVYAKDTSGKTALDLAEQLDLGEVAAMLRWYMTRQPSIFGPFHYVPYWYGQRTGKPK